MIRAQIKETGALTLIQPWADYIFHHGMNVENRQRNSHYRGIFAIHASASKSKAWFRDAPIELDPEKVVYGSIIGFCEVVEVITRAEVTAKTREWFMGEFGFVLENICALATPIPAKGARGVWRLNGKVLAEGLAQLSNQQISRFTPFRRT